MDQSQEVLGVAIANVASGIFGGVPVTAALARTALKCVRWPQHHFLLSVLTARLACSIRSGAKGRFAGIVCALGTMVLAVVAMPLFSYTPMCIVATLLFQVAIGAPAAHAATQARTNVAPLRAQAW